ncbi:hypothetical protein [Micromonospora sp. HUAS LYJ1]|uniref:hypothetical protein n=1 Tax=Micromonospora sp. HUAS LYJ1 TaxID=3061626 RepID=UPI0026734C84|nr:hypothetical protein [Micromonospora sp. HUAS LYJ1]WKU08018.1 hypothetical protein Q2K16_13800 [Micromonospora sp. HUAS LYJ1]
MTTAPANLLAVRRLLLDTIKGLDPAAVGIVGDPAHRGGYHCGSDRVVNNDYSVVESSRDRTGLTLYAAGLDVGTFSIRVGGVTHNLRTFSTWCVGQCRANAPDTRDIREIIYSPDGKVVRRWDRLGKRSSGDDSHLWHTHFSFFRDAIRAGRDQTPLFRRYLTEIGLLKGPDLTPEEHAWLETVHKNLTVLDGRNPIGQIYTRATMGTDDALAKAGTPYTPAHPTLKSLATQMATMQAALLGAVQGLDTQAIIARINAVEADERQRDAQAAAERAEILALIGRWQTGELTADQVVDELSARLGQARE